MTLKAQLSPIGSVIKSAVSRGGQHTSCRVRLALVHLHTTQSYARQPWYTYTPHNPMQGSPAWVRRQHKRRISVPAVADQSYATFNAPNWIFKVKRLKINSTFTINSKTNYSANFYFSYAWILSSYPAVWTSIVMASLICSSISNTVLTLQSEHQ